MKIEEILDKTAVESLTNVRVIGIDIGSRTGKAVLLADGSLFLAEIPTGINMQKTADELLNELLKVAGLQETDIDYIVGTGYGRVAMDFSTPHQIVTEISCHAMGIHYLDATIKTIIDIGGQDSKAIKVDTANGKVEEFVMNDKCAAGTGRFLEKVAQLLDFNMHELGEEAVKAVKPADISSQCVVFAESEVVSFRARGESRENIAAGIHFSTARRVRNLLSRIGLEPPLAFSGGVSNNIGMRRALEVLLECPFKELKLDAIFAGALGAAIHAHNYYVNGTPANQQLSKEQALDLSELYLLIAKQKEDLISGNDSRKKVGYLCTYTPVELIDAAGAAPVRLFKMGNSQEIASGEQITRSVFCDFTKSILGAFKEGDPLYNSMDKVYTFYTCDCIKKTCEAISNYKFTASDVYLLPRLRHKGSSREYYRTEILNFKEELEQLSGNTVDSEKLRERIKIYNKVRKLLKNISELRKRENPPLTGTEFLEIAKAYFYLSPEKLLELYGPLYKKLTAVPENGQKRIRLMMAGGIVADGDRRLLEIVENEIGARIVVEDHCTGIKNVQYIINEDDEPYKALADGYMDQSPCSRMKPLEDRIDISGKTAQEYDVDGILFVYLKFCPCYGQIKHEFFKHYQKLGIPALEVPIDYSTSDHGQLKTRIEAFIDVLKEKV